MTTANRKTSRSHDTAESSHWVDLLFPAHGAAIPRWHGHAVYQAIANQGISLGQVHGIGVFPIRGDRAEAGTLLLRDDSVLRIRLPAGAIPLLLPLTNRRLEVGGHRLRLGTPHIAALVPGPILGSPVVLMDAPDPVEEADPTPDRFLGAARKQLAEMGVRAELSLRRIPSGSHAGQVWRRTVWIEDRQRRGFAMLVRGLSHTDSLCLQTQGLGSARHLGCGLFLSVRQTSNS
ncbi:MAG: type I-MYXAN CRISPR-associated protein Cas6/Cmx6 [Bacillota bacterium]